MKIVIILLISSISLIHFSCNEDDTGSKTEEALAFLEAEVRKDVSYGENTQQAYDLYLPEGRTSDKTKVIVLVHGGGWVEGDKNDINGYIDLIQNTHPDHAIVNTNYILADLNNKAFPNQFLDLQRVINKLKNESEILQISPEFGLIGLSAGAHISLMYDAVYDIEDDVKFVVDIVGPADFTDPFYADDPNYQFLINFLIDTSAYPTGTNYTAITSPALQVSSSSSPTLIFQGNQDPLVPLSNGETLSNAFQTNGIEHQYTVFDGGHGDWNPTQLLDVQQKIGEYIDLYLPIN